MTRPHRTRHWSRAPFTPQLQVKTQTICVPHNVSHANEAGASTSSGFSFFVGNSALS